MLKLYNTIRCKVKKKVNKAKDYTDKKLDLLSPTPKADLDELFELDTNSKNNTTKKVCTKKNRKLNPNI